MVDVHTKTQRSFNMSRIRSKNTCPEMIVRSCVYRMGYRYRLHDKKLPGKPDLVLSRHRKVIFVHGCYWHRHSCKKGRSIPETRKKFWQTKLEGNKERDKRNRRKLNNLGWKVLIIWECQIKNQEKVIDKIANFLKGS